MLKRKKRFDKKLLAYCAFLALPLLQYAIFYIYVNFNAFFLAFSEYDTVTGQSSLVGLKNFTTVWNNFFNSAASYHFGLRLKNALVNYACSVLVGIGGSILFSYYIYKKQWGGGLFKVILFIPSIIPGIALATIYRLLVNGGFRTILNEITGESVMFLMGAGATDSTYTYVLIFGLFFGFATQVLMYLGAMNKINPSITEAAKLDGASFMRELWSITIPCIYGTIVTFLVVGLTGIFTADMGLYSFFGENAPAESQTLGYYLLRETRVAGTNRAEFPEISAIGMMFTIVVAPISIGLKRFLDKKDPMN
ncbi:MAG: sugar ABC transporter permease [Clostridiales bacterium]|nr:sugar ABC transporter permease [Clostridiales bacterium]